MPKYKEGDENKYFPSVIAILFVIAVALGTFIVSLISQGDENLDPVTLQIDEQGLIHVNPGPGMIPDSAPE